MSDPNLPSPEQIQQRLQEFLRNNFNAQAAAHAQAETSADDGDAPEKKNPVFDFSLTPREIKRHLDRYVIRQDDAKRALSIAVCDH